MSTASTRNVTRILLGVALLAGFAPPVRAMDEPAPPAIAAGPVATVDMPEDTPAERTAKASRLFWEAMAVFSSGNESDHARGRVALRHASALGDPHALFEQARYSFMGSYGFKADMAEGARLFIEAAGMGHGFAMVAAGQCYFEGSGVKADLAEADSWLNAALADTADFSRPAPPPSGEGVIPEPGVAGAVWSDPAASARANARYLLGRIAEQRKRPAEAHAHYTAAAYAGIDGRDGIIEAAKQAALGHALGTGTPRDPGKARELIAHALMLSKRAATFQVQSMVQGKTLDEFAAADAEEALAKANDIFFDIFELEIGRKLADRKARTFNPAAAAQWFRTGAEAGKVWHMIDLALLLGGKDLGKPDLAAAFQWWERAGGGTPPESTFAAANLAICLQNGIGTPRNTTRAAELFRRHKDTDFLCYLGTIGQAPKKPVEMQAAEKLLGNWANKKKDAHAQFLLGMQSFDFSNPDWITQPAAAALFKKAALRKHPGALHMLGVLTEDLNRKSRGPLPKGERTAIDLYTEAASLGHAEAAVNAGFLYHNGIRVRQDPAKAEEFYNLALRLDPANGRAHNNLGSIFQERLSEALKSGGGDVAALRGKMLEHYSEAERLGFAYAAVNLGRIYHAGEAVEKDLDRAYDHFSKASAEGVADGQFLLGGMHERGESVPVTLVEAAYQYRLAALQGHMPALRKLVDFYITGKGVTRDLAMAEHWLDFARERRDFSVFPELAEVKRLRGDHAAAFDIYKKMSEWTDARFSGCGFQGMSECYEKGLGVMEDKRIAVGYRQIAIDKGNPDALASLAQSQLAGEKKEEGVATMTRAAAGSGAASYFLGQMYYFGTNVEQDRVKAVNLMRDSARMRYPKAMYFLAAAAFNRDPEAPTLDEAILFASMAENMGVPEAPALREKLERRRDRTEDETELIARPRSG